MFEFKKKSNYFSPLGKTFLFNYISACYIAFLRVMFTLLSYHYIKNPPYLLGLSVNAFLNLQLQCCGKNSYEDWFSTPWERTVNTTSGVPHSCCRIPDTSCNNMNVNANSTYIYQQVIHLYQAIYFKRVF